jgi:hypothetical protein
VPDCPLTRSPRAAPVGRKLKAEEKVRKVEVQSTFDFVVAGFPKCGTTTLLKAFIAHNETDMSSAEKCAIASPAMPDVAVLRKLDETIAEMSPLPNVKRSFKCPTAIYSHKTISRMEQHSPAAKFIIGVRHPILMVQSFYNYRVTEIYQRGLKEAIPSLEEIVSTRTPWKGVSLDAARFELFLMLFGKTDTTPENLDNLLDLPGYEQALRPNNFSIFLYSLDQMDDEDEKRNTKFRSALQHYLELSVPLAPFSHENINHQIGDEGYKETIDICQDKFQSIRVQLIQQAEKSAEWIREQFMDSLDVWIPNEDHFLETLESWGVDPCLSTRR